MSDRFGDLPGINQLRIVAAGNAIGRFVFRHTAAVLVGPPPGAAGRVSNGSGFILRLQGKPYLGTAWHVVESWLNRTSNGERVLFQIGGATCAPTGRIVWKDKRGDLAFLRLEEWEAALIGISVLEPICGWPPPKVSVGDFIHVAGYPAVQREQPADDAWKFRSLGFRLSVKSVGEWHLACQFERQYWVATGGATIPPEGINLGGMSGGPALLEGRLAYPLIGLVAEHTPAYEIMRVSTLSHTPKSF